MIAQLTRNSNVEFCKTFWGLADQRLLSEGPNVMLPSMAICHTFELHPRKLLVPVQPTTPATTVVDEYETTGRVVFSVADDCDTGECGFVLLELVR